MNILITGGAGFIGSHLSEKLLAQGSSVTVIDDLSTGKLENIAHLRTNKNFQFVQDNIRNEQIMHLLISQADMIYHLAAAVGVKLILEKPVHTIETNIHGSEIVLEIANKFSRPLFIASTSEVYGKSEKMPFCEDDDTVLGSTKFSRWSYACSKAIDEFLGLAYHNQFGLPVVLARLFNTVGPRQTGQYGMVIPRFIEKALKNEPIEIYGDGQQSRCFGHVDDVTTAMIDIMKTPKAFGQLFNIGNPQEITIEALADLIIERTNSKSTKKFLSYEQAYGKNFDDMRRRLPSIEKIQKTINFQPKHNLEKIIDDVIEYMK